MAKKTCKWVYDEDEDCWHTSCGNAFVLTEGTLSDNGMVYCCYCGKRIPQKRKVKNGGE